MQSPEKQGCHKIANDVNSPERRMSEGHAYTLTFVNMRGLKGYALPTAPEALSRYEAPASNSGQHHAAGPRFVSGDLPLCRHRDFALERALIGCSCGVSRR